MRKLYFSLEIGQYNNPGERCVVLEIFQNTFDAQQKILLQLYLTLLLLCVYPVQAPNRATHGQAYIWLPGQSKKPQESTKKMHGAPCPYTIHISPYIGLTKEISQLLQREGTTK